MYFFRNNWLGVKDAWIRIFIATMSKMGKWKQPECPIMIGLVK